MNKNEFIQMCIQDAGDDATLLAIVEVFKEVIPSDADVDSTKHPQDFYKHMKKYALDNKKGSTFCINPALAKKLAIEYLKLNIVIKENKSSQILNLEDFF